MRHPKWLLVLAFLISWGWAAQAWSINFVFTYETGNSNPPTINGQVDLFGAQLTSMMNSAATLWEDIIEDNWTINVALRWQVPTLGPNFSGQMSLYGAHPNNTNGDPSEQSGRAVWTLIVMNPNRTWWVDPTPFDNSEFDMTQTLYRDLTSGAGGQQSAWYTGNVPSVLEVGFRGAPNASAPALMQAAGTRDLLTVGIHELGHTIGVGGTQAATNEFSTDGDYDIDTQFVNGANFDVLSQSTGNSHLHPSSTAGAPNLMCVCSLANIRILPSAIDVIAGATVANWTDIDLQRQDFLGGNNWNTAFNWEGDAVPGSADDAFVRTGANVSLSANGRVENLLISNSSEVTTNANTLTVDSTTTLENNSGGLRPFLRVNAGGVFETNDLNLNGSELLLIGGQADISDDLTVRVANGLGGRVTGQGTINIAGDFTNGGVIRPSGGTITINSSAAFPALNLDGIGGAGEIDATVGDLVVNGELLGSFDGLITIGEGRTVTFNDGWELGTSGELNLEGGAEVSDAARIAGSATTLDGPVNVDGLALLNTTTTTIEDGATINLAANTASGTLEINGQTVYAGGNTVGAGVFKQDGDVTVTGNFSVGNAVYDWDGGGLSNMTINPGATLSISSNTVEPTANDGRDATLDINGGTLSVVTAWRLDGTMNLTETGGQAPTLNGVGGVTVHTTGEFNVTGDATINAPVTVNGDMNIGQFGQTAGIARFNGQTEFESTATVTLEQGSVLWLFGDATYRGGSHVGNGTLRLDGTVDILDDTSWGMLTLDWDGSNGNSVTNIGLADSLSIASSTIETTANDGHDGEINITSGQLSVLTAWRLDGEMNMTQIAPQFISPTLNGAGGLTVHTTGQLNTDGNTIINTAVTVNGGVQVVDGIAHFNNNVTFNNTADVVVSISSLSVTDAEVIELNSDTTFNGGSYVGNGTIRQIGDATVNAATTISVGRYDADGEEATPNTLLLNADLTLNVEQIDEPGVVKSGNNKFDATLNITSGATLTVNTPAPWVFNGSGFLGNGGAAPAVIAGSTVGIGDGSIPASLIVNGLGRITAPADFRADAAVGIPNVPSRLEMLGVTTLSGGTYNGLGTMAFDNDLTVLTDTTINTDGLDLDGGTDADHTVTVANGATFTINSIRLDDTNTNFGDTMVIENNATLDVNTNTGWGLDPAGVLRFEGEAEMNPSATLSGQTLSSLGRIEGNGILEVTVITRGTISPGLSAGILQFDQLIQGSASVTEVELGGTAAITEHDQVVVTGGVSLDGALNISLLGGFTPDYFDEFQVITATTRSGEFDQFAGAFINSDMTLAPIYDYGGDIGLTLIAAIPGDANLDGTVNGLDLLTWQANLFSGDEWVQGDFNLDGLVNGLDLLIWQSHLFDTVAGLAGGAAPLASGTPTIPEPGTLGLMGLGVLGIATRRKAAYSTLHL